MRVRWLVLCATLGGCGRLGFDRTSGALEIVSITPGFASPAGGVITIEMADALSPAALVTVDGAPCTGIAINGTTITCTAAAHDPATVSLVVTDAFAEGDARFVYVTDGAYQRGTGLDDRSSGVAIDPDGNVFIAGGTNGDLDGTNRGDYDAVLIKYDASGTVAWIRQLGTPMYDYARDVATADDGSVTLVGATNGMLGTTQPAGLSDVFVARFDNDGNQEWVTQIGSTGEEQAWDVGCDGSGAAIVAMETSGVLAAPGVGGNYDFAIARIGATGSVEWIRQGGAIEGDEGHSVAVATDGTAYLVGGTGGTLEPGQGAGLTDMFIARYDVDGTQRWLRQRGGPGEELATDAQIDPMTGDVWLVGYSTLAFDGQQNAGGNDVFAMRFTSDGQWQFTRSFGSPGNELTFGVAPTPTGAILACNTDMSFDGQPQNAGSDDICAIAIRGDGTREWTRIVGSTLGDQASSLALDRNLTGFVYISAITSDSLDAMPNRGGNDIAVVKLDLLGAVR